VSNYLIRVQLPDRPGALGAVASRIGSVGGDVISIDILERDGGVVVDELGVGLAGDHLIALLRDEILEVDGVVIESVRPVDGSLPDRFTELLAVATELLVQTSPAGLLERLTIRVRRNLGAASAVVFDPAADRVVSGDGDQPEHGALAASALLAQVESADSGVVGPAEPVGTVLTEGRRSTAVACVVDPDHPDVVAVRMPQAGLVLVVERAEPRLRERERQWISTMAELADHGWRELV
jgi:hypothetical protein